MDGAISIGRNVGEVPMSGQDWRKFVRAVAKAVTDLGGTIYANARGKGKWEGIPEQNAVLTFGGIDNAETLTEQLNKLRLEFSQASIALLIGSTLLITQ